MPNKKYFIKTFGCQMNFSDSERLASLLEKLNLTPAKKIDAADLVIFNTCGVRQTAENRFIGQLRNLRKKNKKSLVIVIGCLVNRKDIHKKTKGNVQLFLPTSSIPLLHQKIKKVAPDFFENAIHSFLKPEKNYLSITPKYKNKKEAFVPIMTGCNNFCSYCVVPYARGREISRPPEEIFFEIKKLAQKKYQKILLLGQNVNSYHHISKEPLHSLVLDSPHLSDSFSFLPKSLPYHSESPPVILSVRKESLSLPVILSVSEESPFPSCHSERQRRISFFSCHSERQRRISFPSCHSERKRRISFSSCHSERKRRISFFSCHSERKRRISEQSEDKPKKENKISFSKLLDFLAKSFPKIEFSFLTSHPKDFSENLIATIAKNPNISKNIHLPLQSGSNRVLKDMNRPYTKENYLKLVEKIKKAIPTARISTDIIVGFPTETEKDFLETVDVFKKVNFSEAFINKYSPRPGTVALKLGDPISWQEKKRREKILRDLL